MEAPGSAKSLQTELSWSPSTALRAGIVEPGLAGSRRIILEIGWYRIGTQPFWIS